MDFVIATYILNVHVC